MISKQTMCRIGLVVGSVAAALAPSAVRAQAPPPPVETDLNKQVDDALKEIDKLNKIIPDDARELMRQRVVQLRPAPVRTIGSGYTIGVQLQKPLPILVEQMRLPPTQGLVINDVRPDTLAAKSGLLKYDVLMEFNGKPVPSEVAAFNNDIKDVKQGTELVFGVIRRGMKVTIKSARLAEAVAQPVVAPAPKVVVAIPPKAPAPPKPAILK